MTPRKICSGKRQVATTLAWAVLFGLIGSIWFALPAIAQESDMTPPQSETAESSESDAPAPAIRRRGDLISIFSGDVIIEENVYQAGQIVCVGGDVIIEGEVRDDVLIIGGSLRLTGTVKGSVIGVLSFLELDDATVRRELINAGGTLEQRNSQIGGEVFNIGFGDWISSLPSPFGVFGFFVVWGRVVKLVLAFVVILLLAALVPERIRLIADEVPVRIGSAFFVGLLGYIGLLVVMTILAATVVGFPFGLIVFRVFKWLGIAGIFFAVGRRVGRSIGREMSLLGAVLLVFLPFVALQIVPWLFGPFGWFLGLFLGLLTFLFLEVPALGMILLTRGGTRVGRAPTPPPTIAVSTDPLLRAETDLLEPPEPLEPADPPAESGPDSPRTD
jgi:hypothetical protein